MKSNKVNCLVHNVIGGAQFKQYSTRSITYQCLATTNGLYDKQQSMHWILLSMIVHLFQVALCIFS
jgi:hypothetical protein